MDSEPPFTEVQRTLPPPPDGGSAELEAVAWQAALGGLVADVVHTVNNGLFGVLATLELLLADAGPTSEAAGRLRVAQRAARELEQAVAALGALARDEPGRPALDELAGAAVDLLQRLGRRRLVVERDPAAALPVAAAGADVRRLVVQALLLASTAAGPTGALALALAAEAGEAVLLVAWEDGERDVGDDPLLPAVQASAARLGGSLRADDPASLRLALPLA